MTDIRMDTARGVTLAGTLMLPKDAVPLDLELLEADAVPPGVHRQLVRVLGELVSNMAKYAASGSARIIVDSDGRSLEAMAANAAPPQNGADAAASSMPAVSSGLGLAGARRRVESLGGVFDVGRAQGRWTVVLSIPLRAAP